MGLALAVNTDEITHPSEREAAPSAFAPKLVGISKQITLGQLIQLTEAAQNGGRSDEAVGLYTAWATESQDPQRYLALFNLGSLLQSLGRLPDAKIAYENCLAVQPHLGQALINLGLVYETLGEHAQAFACWTRHVAAQYTDPSWDKGLGVMALNHIGRLQEIQKRYDLAELALEHSLRLDTQQAGVIQHWVHVRQKACQWPVYTPLPGISMNKMLTSTSPLAQLAVDDDPVKQLLVASSFVERTYSNQQSYLSKGKKYRHNRIRLGYVSGDLCMHAVGLLLGTFLEAHDRTRFELFAYDFSVEDGSAHRARLKQAFDHFQGIGQLTDQQAAERILADEIDVLIDMHGLSSGARPGIFSRHPAPLQGTYLGFMGTTAMPWLDFVVVDRYVMPPELTPYFVEKPLYVDGSFIPLTTQPAQPRTMTRQECGLPEDAFVMASFGNVYKINETLFTTWLELLQEKPDSVLWLIDDNSQTTQNLRAYAAQAGVDASRIIFSPRTGYDDYRAKLRLIDVFLDTFPYNCGSTANDVIEAGIPMVTCSGKTLVSRMGGSILSALGQSHLIANSLPQYKQLVLALARGDATAVHTPASKERIHETCKSTVQSFEEGLSTLLAQTYAAGARA